MIKYIKEKIKIKNTYHLVYLFSLLLTYLAFFLKRYNGLLNTKFLWILSIAAIMASVSTFVWSIKKFGWTSRRSVIGLFGLMFLIFIPLRTYIINAPLDLTLVNFFFLSVSIDKEDEFFVNRIFYIKLIGFILILLAYNKHIIPDMIMNRDGGIIRHSYGFMHPNSFGMYVLSLINDFILIKQRRKFSHVLFLLSVNLLTYAITDSRTTFFAILVLTFAYCFKPTLEKYFVSYVWLIPLVLLSMSVGFLLPYYYSEQSHIYAILNKLFSGRLMIGHEYYNRFGMKWYPRDIAIVNDFHGISFYNDSFYIDSLMRHGVIIATFYPLAIIVNLFKKKLSIFHSILFLSTFWICMMEGYGASVFVFTILLVDYFSVDIEGSETVSKK